MGIGLCVVVLLVVTSVTLGILRGKRSTNNNLDKEITGNHNKLAEQNTSDGCSHTYYYYSDDMTIMEDKKKRTSAQ